MCFLFCVDGSAAVAGTEALGVVLADRPVFLLRLCLDLLLQIGDEDIVHRLVRQAQLAVGDAPTVDFGIPLGVRLEVLVGRHEAGEGVYPGPPLLHVAIELVPFSERRILGTTIVVLTELDGRHLHDIQPVRELESVNVRCYETPGA